MTESMAIQLPWRYKTYQTLAMGGFAIPAVLWIIGVQLTMNYGFFGMVLITLLPMYWTLQLTSNLAEGKLPSVISRLHISPENPQKKIHQHLTLYISMDYAMIPLTVLNIFSHLITQPNLTTFNIAFFLYFIVTIILIIYFNVRIRRTPS